MATPGEDTDDDDPGKHLGLLPPHAPRLRLREFMEELSSAEHRRLPGRQSGTECSPAPRTPSQSYRGGVRMKLLEPSPQLTQLTGQAPLDETRAPIGSGQLPIARRALIPRAGWRPPGGHRGTPCPQPPAPDDAVTSPVGRRVTGTLRKGVRLTYRRTTAANPGPTLGRKPGSRVGRASVPSSLADGVIALDACQACRSTTQHL